MKEMIKSAVRGTGVWNEQEGGRQEPFLANTGLRDTVVNKSNLKKEDRVDNSETKGDLLGGLTPGLWYSDYRNVGTHFRSAHDGFVQLVTRYEDSGGAARRFRQPMRTARLQRTATSQPG